MEKLIKIKKIDIRMQSLNGHRMLKNASNELIFGPDMHSNEFYRFTKAFLRNFENCLIYGQKTPPFVKNSKSLNGHRMLPNASNELKFGPDMYFDGFYQFFKEFLINFENCLIYGQKTRHF